MGKGGMIEKTVGITKTINLSDRQGSRTAIPQSIMEELDHPERLVWMEHEDSGAVTVRNSKDVPVGVENGRKPLYE